MKKKTKRGWGRSKLDLDEYLSHPCEIDEDLYHYILGIVPPAYLGDNGYPSQGGDPVASIEGDDRDVMIYMTVSYVADKFYYLGLMPEFKT